MTKVSYKILEYINVYNSEFSLEYDYVYSETLHKTLDTHESFVEFLGNLKFEHIKILEVLHITFVG